MEIKIIYENLVSITDGQFSLVGKISFSPDKNCFVVYDDTHFSEKSEKNIVFVQNKNIIKIFNSPRPSAATVSNNGFFLLSEYKNLNEPNNRCLLFNNKGEIVFEKKFKANNHIVGVSDNGIYIAMQNLWSENKKHSNLLIIYNLEEQKITHEIYPDFRTESIKFDETNGLMHLLCPNGYIYKELIINLNFENQ